MQKVKCAACRSIETKQLNNISMYRNYNLMECIDCGLRFILSENFETLDDDIYWDDINKKIYSMPMVLKEFKKKHNKNLKHVKKISPPNKNLLDVGCGNGIFLKNAKSNDFNVTGIEPSQIAVELCEKQHGITPFHGYLEIDSNLPKDYGILSAWDVIEHVSDPKEFLKICHTHLEQGGIFLLETPDESSIVRKIINIVYSAKRLFNKSVPSNIYYPSHRYYFTHKSIKILLNEAGFSNVRIYKEFSIYSKSKAKYKHYGNFSKFQLIKYNIIFTILKFPLFWNKQVILCTKD